MVTGIRALAATLLLAGPAVAASHDEPIARTTHEIQLEGTTLRYTAEAGRLVLPDSAGREPRGAIFYVAYRAPAAGKPRPLTFLWNGGPGSNSVLLHFEAFAPRRLENGAFVDNPATLLGVSDLVFVDPIGTGFSRAETAAHEPGFYSTLGDIDATTEFVRRWCAGHDVAGAPLFLAGESFGTWRAAGVAERLAAGGQRVAGIILISGGCPVGPILPAPQRTALRVPGWAAVALHHGRLAPEPGGDPEATITAAARWAADRYAPALARLDSLPEAERDSIVAGLAHYSGLAPDQIDRATLGIGPRRYLQSLLRDRGDTLNTFDMRLVGANRPLPAAPIGGYLRGDLGYRTTLAYRNLEPDSTAGPLSVNRRWNYDSGTGSPADMAAARAGEGPPGAEPWVTRALALDPGLRVLVGAGRYDSINSCWANEDLARRLPATIAGNFTFRCYVGGHMMYRDSDARAQLARDVRGFIMAGR